MRFSNNQKEINSFIEKAFDLGINYFESGSFYIENNCENLLGTALKSYSHNFFYLAAKFSFVNFLESKLTLEDYFDIQLKKHQVEYFDFYLIQAIDRNKINKDLPFIISFFQNKKKQGYIKNLGFSFHDNQFYLKKIINYNWDFIQIQLNYYDWFVGEARDNYNLIKKYNIPIFVMGAQKGGILSSHFELAYRFLNTLDNVKLILNGSNDQTFLQKNVKIIEENKKLTKEDLFNIKTHIANLKIVFFIPCTQCNYCLGKCINNIDISKTFTLYNKALKNSDYKNEYFKLLKENNSPLECIGCKNCEQYCPQHLEISKYMLNNIFNYRL